jgi:hypothetical protein
MTREIDLLHELECLDEAHHDARCVLGEAENRAARPRRFGTPEAIAAAEQIVLVPRAEFLLRKLELEEATTELEEVRRQNRP